MENSPFNKLSAELRNKIYELALAHDTPLAVCKKHPDPDSTAVQPPLTRVCRQIRDEALGMFYQFNTFVMELISSQIWKWPADDKWGFPLERLKEKEQRCDDTEHAPTWISEILDRRTWEVSEWLKCTSQEHHDVIKKANIVIGTNVFHWEKDFYGKRNNIFDWAPLVEMLRQYGYCGKVGQQKVNAVVRLIIKYTWNDEKRWLTYLCEQLAQEAAKFFEDLVTVVLRCKRQDGGISEYLSNSRVQYSTNKCYKDSITVYISYYVKRRLVIPMTKPSGGSTQANIIRLALKACDTTPSLKILSLTTSPPLDTMDASPLKKLPAELRNKVFKLAVVADEPIAISSSYPGYDIATQPPLTRVCRQTRNETLEIFYHFNTFVVEVVSAECYWDFGLEVSDRKEELSKWLEHTSEKNRAAIQKLHFVFASEPVSLRTEPAWQDLTQTLIKYGYGGKGEGGSRLEATVQLHLVFHRLLWAEPAVEKIVKRYCRRQERKAREQFENLGFEVMVTSELLPW
ncbi:hypothetical protein BST61_g5531 [Cercospora zeina]